MSILRNTVLYGPKFQALQHGSMQSLERLSCRTRIKRLLHLMIFNQNSQGCEILTHSRRSINASRGSSTLFRCQSCVYWHILGTNIGDSRLPESSGKISAKDRTGPSARHHPHPYEKNSNIHGCMHSIRCHRIPASPLHNLTSSSLPRPIRP